MADYAGAIGPVQDNYAIDSGFSGSNPAKAVAEMQNASGKFTLPTPVDVASALAYATQQPNGTHVLDFNGLGPNVYNPSTYSYLLTPTTGWSSAKGAVMSNFVNFVLTLGQEQAPKFQYASLGLSLERYGIDKVIADVPGAVDPTTAEDSAYACGDLTPTEVQAGQTTPTCGVTNGTAPPAPPGAPTVPTVSGGRVNRDDGSRSGDQRRQGLRQNDVGRGSGISIGRPWSVAVGLDPARLHWVKPGPSGRRRWDAAPCRVDRQKASDWGSARAGATMSRAAAPRALLGAVLLLAGVLWGSIAGIPVAGAQTDASTLVGEGSSFLTPVTNLLLNADASALAPLVPSYTDAEGIDNAIADFVGSAPGLFDADFVVSERALTSAETTTASANGRQFAYVPFAATPVAIAALVVAQQSYLSTVSTPQANTFYQDIPLTPALVGLLFFSQLAGSSSSLPAPLTEWADPRLTQSNGQPLANVNGVGINWASQLGPAPENTTVMSLVDSDPTAKAELDAAIANPNSHAVTSSDAPSEVWPFQGDHSYPGGDNGLLNHELTIDATTDQPSLLSSWGGLGGGATATAPTTSFPFQPRGPELHWALLGTCQPRPSRTPTDSSSHRSRLQLLLRSPTSP